MKTSSKIALFVALLLLLAGGVTWYVGRAAPPTADQRIVQTLRDAEDAAKRGSVNGVMDTISQEFRAGAWDRGKVKLLLLRSMSQGRAIDYDVRVNAPKIQAVPGKQNERYVITRFAAFYAGSGEDIYKTGEPVILLMREETRRKWLVFREPYWRVVGVVNLPALPGSDGPGGFGGFGGLN